MTEEVGVIGEFYQDRRDKRVGKLVGRDSKYKTLMFESEDGSTFIKTYSTFRIQMVPYQNNKVAKMIKSKNNEVNDFTLEVVSQLKQYEKDFHNQNVCLRCKPSSNMFTLQVYNRVAIEMYTHARKNAIQVMLTELDFNIVKEQIKFSDIKKRNQYKRNVCIVIDLDDFSSFLDAMREVVINKLTETNKKSKEED